MVHLIWGYIPHNFIFKENGFVFMWVKLTGVALKHRLVHGTKQAEGNSQSGGWWRRSELSGLLSGSAGSEPDTQKARGCTFSAAWGQKSHLEQKKDIRSTNWFLTSISFLICGAALLTCTLKDVCGDGGQVMSEEGHVGLGDVHAVQHSHRRLSLLTESCCSDQPGKLLPEAFSEKMSLIFC